MVTSSLMAEIASESLRRFPETVNALFMVVPFTLSKTHVSRSDFEKLHQRGMFDRCTYVHHRTKVRKDRERSALFVWLVAVGAEVHGVLFGTNVHGPKTRLIILSSNISSYYFYDTPCPRPIKSAAQLHVL